MIIAELYKFLLGICGVFFVRGVFFPVLWGFSGHFFVVVGICPGFVALSRDIFFLRRGLSRNFGVFRDISPRMRHFLPVWRSKQGCFAATQDFVPEFGRVQGHFLSAVNFVPVLWRFSVHFLMRNGFRAEFVPNSRS